MEAVFWLLLATLAWCYAGYPGAVILRARFWPRPLKPQEDPGRPLVSVVVAVRNGQALIERRLDDLFSSAHDAERLEAIVVCNGCSDDTEAIARAYALRDSRVRVLATPAEHGKSGALNAGVAAATGEFVVFTDVRQTFRRDAIARLIEPFSDPEVGAASGRLVIGRGDRAAVEGVRWYWGLETGLRRAENRTGSVMGVTGAIYAIRRSLFEPLPPNLILDDVYVPMRLVLAGRRVVLVEEAVALDVPSRDSRQEFLRKRRTMVGNLQLVRALPALVVPGRNPAFVRFVSHKLLRLATPICCVGTVALAGFLAGPLYATFFWSGVAVYALGILGLFVHHRLLAVPAAFTLMHLAILSAFLRFRQDAGDVWQAERGPGRGDSRAAQGEALAP